jgi:apolipoprotein N-acyltransferase
VDTTRVRPLQPHVSTETATTTTPRDHRTAAVVGLVAGTGLAGLGAGWAGIGVAVVELFALVAVIAAALFAIASVVLTVVEHRRGEQ